MPQTTAFGYPLSEISGLACKSVDAIPFQGHDFRSLADPSNDPRPAGNAHFPDRRFRTASDTSQHSRRHVQVKIGADYLKLGRMIDGPQPAALLLRDGV